MKLFPIAALVKGTTDRCGLLTLTPHHPSGSEAAKPAGLLAGPPQDRRLWPGQDLRFGDEAHLRGGHLVVPRTRGSARPALQQHRGHLECRLHHLRDVQSARPIPGHLRKESAGPHLRVSAQILPLKSVIFNYIYAISRRLTGRPTEQQWPQTISVALEHFPQRHPKRPKDFCPHLCKYADDLLNVSMKMNIHILLHGLN